MQLSNTIYRSYYQQDEKAHRIVSRIPREWSIKDAQAQSIITRGEADYLVQFFITHQLASK